MSKPLRLDRILANFGFGSRSTVRELLTSGRVKVGDEVVSRGEVKARPGEVRVDDQELDHPEGIFVMLNKPAGFVCSHSEGEGPLIYDLLPPSWLTRKPAPESVGRLDKNTSGLILLTDQSALIHRLTSPKEGIEKFYEVELDPRGPGLEPKLVAKFASGKLRLTPDDPKPCLPARLEIQGEHRARLVLTEGRFHQVKRMFWALGYRVVGLHRSRFGDWVLGELPEGEWRDLEWPGG